MAQCAVSATTNPSVLIKGVRLVQRSGRTCVHSLGALQLAKANIAHARMHYLILDVLRHHLYVVLRYVLWHIIALINILIS